MFASSFSGCVENNENTDRKMNVTAVSFVQYDFARAISGGLCNVNMIMKPGSEYHGYEPSFSDIKKISESDVFIYNGGESDIWIHEISRLEDVKNTLKVPLANYAKLLGIKYTNDNGKITLEQNGKVLTLKAVTSTDYASGDYAVEKLGEVYVPIRYVSENFGYKIRITDEDGATSYKITIEVDK